jgi:hypothetical protein
MAPWSDESANAYLYFVQALEALSAGPPEQCERMGDYNVAWELQDEVMAGQHLLNLSIFDETQTAILEALMRELGAIPPELLASAVGREVNLLAMNDSRWEGPRRLARRLLTQLEVVSRENQSYLRIAETSSNPTFQRTASRPLN